MDTPTSTVTETVQMQKQMMLASRLYTKIDYLKSNRMRVPVAVAVANFALVSLFKSEASFLSALVLAGTIFFVGHVGKLALESIRELFDKNNFELEYLYQQLNMKTSEFMEDPNLPLAEPATLFWDWLFKLITLCWIVPLLLLLLTLLGGDS